MGEMHSNLKPIAFDNNTSNSYDFVIQAGLTYSAKGIM
jgi:hypothetical protein